SRDGNTCNMMFGVTCWHLWAYRNDVVVGAYKFQGVSVIGGIRARVHYIKTTNCMQKLMARRVSARKCLWVAAPTDVMVQA
ncbi:conserved hypothetical protein, partial [Ricinus communis]